jgi:Cu-processing system permease protein
MAPHIYRILSLSRLLIIDGLKRHAIIGLILFSLAAEASALLFFDFIPRDIGRASIDFLFSLIWLTGMMFLLFHAIQVMALSDDSKTIHTYLARPISRTEYVLGLFCGFSVLLFLLNGFLGTIGWFLLQEIKHSVDIIYFPNLAFGPFLLSLSGIYCIELFILAVSVLLCTAVRGTFTVLLLVLSYNFICSGLPVVREMLKIRLKSKDNASEQSIDVLLRWLTAIFPDFSRFDFRSFISDPTSLPSLSQFGVTFGLVLLYLIVVLWAACAIFQRRDLQ